MTGKADLALLLPLLLAALVFDLAGCASPRERETIQANAEEAAAPASSGETRTPQTDPSDASHEEDPDQTPDDSEASDAQESPERPERIVLDTVYDDRRVGKDQLPIIEAELGLVEDEELNRFVRSVAVRLLRHAPSRPFEYEFKIVDQSVPNAFALPGGKIFVSRGLLALATSEDELAGVLGHEITHAAERHASAQIEYNRRMNPLAIGLLRVARLAAYGRDQERDADRGGQILAARAGYDPEALATFLRKLDAAERYEVGWSRIPRFYATHPTSPERSALATNRATTLEWTAAPPVSSEYPDGYYGAIDGLILGEDPAGGVFDEENRFNHPELRFSIRFPQGWTTMNSQQAVRAVSPMRDAQAELTLAGKSDEPLSEIVDDFIDSEFDGMKIRVRERQEIKIGELPAIRIEGRTTSLGIGGLAVQMTFVAYGDFVYRLTVLSVGDSGTRFRGRARAFAHSFRPIDEETVRSLDVTRLRTARALENETLQELSVRTRNALDLVYTGVLNGVYASTPLARRQPIKIGIKEPYLPRPDPDGNENDQDPDATQKSDVILDSPTR